jgi:hypothetical protein
MPSGRDSFRRNRVAPSGPFQRSNAGGQGQIARALRRNLICRRWPCFTMMSGFFSKVMPASTSRSFALPSFLGQLFGQFRSEGFFSFGDVLFIAAGIDERACLPRFDQGIFFFQAEITAMGAEKNVAWQ